MGRTGDGHGIRLAGFATIRKDSKERTPFESKLTFGWWLPETESLGQSQGEHLGNPRSVQGVFWGCFPSSLNSLDVGPYQASF